MTEFVITLFSRRTCIFSPYACALHAHISHMRVDLAFSAAATVRACPYASRQMVFTQRKYTHTFLGTRLVCSLTLSLSLSILCARVCIINAQHKNVCMLAPECAHGPKVAAHKNSLAPHRRAVSAHAHYIASLKIGVVIVVILVVVWCRRPHT